MTILALLRTLGALTAVLAMLGLALWATRRFDLRLPSRVGGSRERRVEVIERLAVDAKRTLLLVRRDRIEHLVLMGPDGSVVLSDGRDAPSWQAAYPPPRAAASAVPVGSGTMALPPAIGGMAFPGYLANSQTLLARRLNADG